MIKIQGSYRLAARRDQVWPRIFDPSSLMSLIPGCNRIEQISPNEYRGQVKVGLASVSGTYDTRVNVIQAKPPEFCQFEGEINGPSGFIQGTATFTLKEEEEESTIQYQAQALVTGALGKLSPRFIEGVVNTLIKLGLASLNSQLQGVVPNLK